MFRCAKLPILVVIFALLAGGCGGEPGPEFVPVEGVVRVNGKPDRGVTVRFSPDAERGNGLPAVATGTTDDQGKYSLTYEFRGQEGPGAPVGWHRVTLIDTKVGFTPQGQRPKPSSIPYTYGNPSTSPLVFEVKAGDPQTVQKIDIDVKR